MNQIIKQYAYSLAFIFFIALGVTLSTTPAKAQMNIKPGVRVGFNSASFGGDTDEFAQAFADLGGQLGADVSVDTGRRSGFMIGGFAILDFAGPFALQPGLRYIQRGYTIDLTLSGGGQSISADGTIKVDYIDVPVLARYEFPSAGITPHVFAGPTVGFNVSAEEEVESGGQTDTEDISDTVSGTDFGLEFGAGVDFGFSAGTVTVDARYGLGLTDVPDEGDFSLKNRALMITAGFAF